MRQWLRLVFRLAFKHHLLISLGIVLVVAEVIGSQVGDRRGFADGDLKRDVMDRWGAPIVQPSPSVRYVASGAVFNELRPLALESQVVSVDAAMNYRKRGLVYFSGFDFNFSGSYEARNPEPGEIELAFVFPIRMRRNQVLLSDLAFTVNGRPTPVELADESDRLVWTGRAKPGERLSFGISFHGRGLESFTYLLDPATRVNNFSLAFNVTGGSNFDYPPEVVPSNDIARRPDGVALKWAFASLESGVPVGLILPSEQSADSVIATSTRRAWAPFILLFLGVVCLSLWAGKELRFYEAWLIAATYALTFVLLAYLAAFMPFALAYVLALGIPTLLLCLYLNFALSRMAGFWSLGLSGAFLLVPTLAVILEGYTGLIYTLEITAGLAGLMLLTTRPAFRLLIDKLSARPTPETKGEVHAA